MMPTKVFATHCVRTRSILLTLELNEYTLKIVLGENLPEGCYEGDIDTLELFKFIRENMDLRTINQFKQLEEIEE